MDLTSNISGEFTRGARRAAALSPLLLALLAGGFVARAGAQDAPSPLRRSQTTRVSVGVPARAFAATTLSSSGSTAETDAQQGPHIVEEKSGAFLTREGLRLRIVTDLGNVRVATRSVAAGQSPAVQYKVHLEADARDPEAPKYIKEFSLVSASGPAGPQLTGQVPWKGFHGRLWVLFDVTVPQNYSLEVQTQAGNIEVGDIDGRVNLMTGGGNITTGRVGGHEPASPHLFVPMLASAARLDSGGGHIVVRDIGGDLRAITGGGHITAANVVGDAVLRSGGGNIRVATVRGSAQLDTGGGTISIERAGSVTASTGGGPIEMGQAAGPIRAHTNGGGIRVLRVAGPTDLQTTAGSILLTDVQGGLKALTGNGSITAWFAQSSAASPITAQQPSSSSAVWKLVGASDLQSSVGDIVVYLPQNLAVTIDATVELGGDHRIEADPALPVKISYTGGVVRAAGPLRAQCTLNGGGEVLRLKTVSGTIRLKPVEPSLGELKRMQLEMEMRMKLQMMRQMLDPQKMQELYQQLVTDEQKRVGRELQQQMTEAQRALAQATAEAARAGEEQQQKARIIWLDRLEESWFGGVGIEPDEQQRRLVYSVRPEYPDTARRAGVEGIVKLRVLIGRDGRVEDVRPLEGAPLLVEAAAKAVRQWRYEPVLLNGKPARVRTFVNVEFRIQ